MKFFAVFAAVVAVACATPFSWTPPQVAEAIDNPTTNAVLKPVLENALNAYMDGVFNGHLQGPIRINTAAGSAGTYTLSQLDAALQHPVIVSSILEPYFEAALNELMASLFEGGTTKSIDVKVPAFELSYWNLQELDAALSDPATSPVFVPYLIKALDTLMDDLINGGSLTGVVVAAPVEVVAPAPIPSPVIDASPVAPSPISPLPTPTPIETSPVAVNPTPVAASSDPLVQIIINIQNGNAPAAPVETPEVGPIAVAPVLVEEGALVPEVSPVDVVDINPEFNPIDIIAINPESNPVDVIAVNPEFNPIDVIAVNPMPVNPVDIISGLPVEQLAPTPEVVVGPL